MQAEIIINVALPGDIGWIDARYREAAFKPSVFDDELIAIARVDGRKAGLGRLQPVEGGIAELGGIYVDENYRGLGLARKIVEFLVVNSRDYRRIFCLPFSGLEGFYGEFGFHRCGDSLEIPAAVSDKHAWCNATYPEKVLLLVLERDSRD